ncbi:MAG: GNAT family N-acetyltransferase [Defluviitaleaceae bacterium]|nr:GNAT family N-acetyltransferase [Defluviitaleaceae bacterium]
MKFLRANELTFDTRGQLSRVFVEGFYEWLRHFSKDKDVLIEVFTHIFLPEYFFVAIGENDKVAAMAACTQGHSPINLQRKEFVRVLGFIRGNFAYLMLKRHIVRNAYPFSISKNTGTIEFVTTAEEFRHQRIGFNLLSFIFEQSPYDSYILEVADTNKNAVSLYEKLGFKEMKRIKAAKRSDVNFFVYMRKNLSDRDA